MARERYEIDPVVAKELFVYDPDTGELRWRVWVNNRAPAGAVAGCVAKAKRAISPYRVVRVRGRMYFAHRIIFAIMVGEVPHEIDHINGDGLDNRWSNLRPCSKGQNNANSRKRRGTRSAYKGVTYYKPGLKHWRARITLPDRPPWTIGYFHTEEEAHAVYQAAAQEHFGAFARSPDTTSHGGHHGSQGSPLPDL